MFNGMGFATYEPGSASAAARSTLVGNYQPGVTPSGIVGPTTPNIPIAGLVGVLAILVLLHYFYRRTGAAVGRAFS